VLNYFLLGLCSFRVTSGQSPGWMQCSEIIISACAAIIGEEHFRRQLAELRLKAKPKG
jgi:hypothetical protein